MALGGQYMSKRVWMQHLSLIIQGGGGISCQVKFAVVNFAVENFAEPRGFCVVKFHCGKFCGHSQKC